MKLCRLFAALALLSVLPLTSCGTSPEPLYVELQDALPVRIRPDRNGGKPVEVKLTGRHGRAVMRVNGRRVLERALPENETDDDFSNTITIPLALIGDGRSWGGRSGDLIELREADANWIFYGDRGVMLSKTGTAHVFRVRNPAALKAARQKYEQVWNAFIRQSLNAGTEEEKQKAAAAFFAESGATAPFVIPGGPAPL